MTVHVSPHLMTHSLVHIINAQYCVIIHLQATGVGQHHWYPPVILLTSESCPVDPPVTPAPLPPSSSCGDIFVYLCGSPAVAAFFKTVVMRFTLTAKYD